ncbi:MAG: FAD:protein FMN transferase [Rhodothermaceae bacterium]|nr:FAD:protein FMN transferase [Rhodothermaceae bacterium]
MGATCSACVDNSQEEPDLSKNQGAPSGVQQEETLSPERYQYTQLHLGVQVRIVLFAENEAIAASAATAAYAKITTLEDIFSTYRVDSEISRLIKAPAYEPVLVSTPLFTVIDFAQSLSRNSYGAFDITLGPYVSLWKEARDNKQLPNMIDLEAATDKVGWHLIETNDSNQSVTLNQKSMQLDMGGIAKGYILDRALETLSEQGIESALIEAGGDIVVSGPPAESSGWNIEIPGAEPDNELALKAGTLTHSAISTSGDTEQYVDIGGIRYSHVIDPSTGLGSTKRLLVTVIAPNGMMSDSYATALGVMDAPSQKVFLKEHPNVLAYIRQAQ